MLVTLFKLMLRNLENILDFLNDQNIFAFLHCWDNSEYAFGGQSGYNPKKKLGFS